MATPKKSSASKRKPAQKKTAASEIKDAAVTEEKTETEMPVEPSKDAAAAPSQDAVTAEKTDTKDEKAASDESVEPTIAPENEAPKADTNKPDADKADPTRTENKVPEQPAAALVPVTPQPEQSRSIFLPLILGGIVAAGIGYFASEYDWFSKGDPDAMAQLQTDLEAQQERLVALESATPEPVEIPEVDLSPLQTKLDDLETRLTALEDRPVVVAPEGVDVDAVAAAAAATYAAELEGLRSSVENQRGEIQALLDNAKSVEEATADAAKIASAQTAIAKIVSALDAGQPFPDALAELQSLDLGEIDPALDAVAADGAATLSVLQAEFPDQARAALATARAGGADEGQQGLGSFLKRSLGARSVAPREGDDPDAVLSRAEAAIKSGDLNATLTELDTLPEDAQAAIADWRAAADARVSAREAADALAQRLTAD